MSIQILLREYPYRSIALVTDSYALIFRCCPTGSSNSNTNIAVPGFMTDDPGTSRCIVEFLAKDCVDLNYYQLLSPLPVYGTLGLITINNIIFICVVTGAKRVASVRPGETAEKIYGVEFYCLNASTYDHTSREISEQNVTEDGFLSNIRVKELSQEHPCAELQKLLCDGSFYFSTNVDLTNSLQNRNVEASNLDMDHMDTDFLWNSFMIDPLVKFRSQLLRQERKILDNSRTLTSAIRGFIMTMSVPSSSSPLRNKDVGASASLTIISRLSCRRAGTRFNSRGIDDDGNVANFVESETVYYSPLVSRKAVSLVGNVNTSGTCFSYVQIRGSVPIFWEQAAGLIPGQQKISMTRSPEGTLPSFNKHFSELERKYGLVHIINLLSETKTSEVELTTLYRKAVKSVKEKWSREKYALDHEFLKETEFDFHAETKGPGGYEAASLIRRLIQSSANGFAYFLCEEQIYSDEDSPNNLENQTVVALKQQGVFRTNCLDCLDRTNLIQSIISQMAIEAFLAHRNEQATSVFWMCHSSLWADNGDALSRIYAGTGALKSSFTRHGKMSLAGALADARKSATRLYINNFADKARQNNIDLLLGRSIGQKTIHLFDPINEYVMAELFKKASEYQSLVSIKIWCGTFNLNGRNICTQNDLSSWLFPDLDHTQETPEIYATGFQEIVELSPQQIMSSDPTRKEAWERIVLDTLNKKSKSISSECYILLRSSQLVGVSLMIFVKKSALAHIRNVEGSVIKTGMSGMAGNKGAVAIRMDYADTPLCFVTAHFAAGFVNYEERNSNFATINQGLRFQRNRGIDDHSTVIWMGDFNYRITLDNEKVRNLIRNGELDTLYQNDQLNLQMIAGSVFPYYSESKITFAPTYKFDIGTNIYDTSEKLRVPAWTDRILLKGSNTRQIDYNSVPLQFSDHRPVYGIFICVINIIDEIRKETLSRQIFKERKAQINGTLSIIKHNNSEERLKAVSSGSDLLLGSPIKQDLWLNGSQELHSQILSPRKVSTHQKLSHPIKKPRSIIKSPDLPAIRSSSVTWNTPTTREFANNLTSVTQVRGLSKTPESEDSKKYNLNDDQITSKSSTLPNYVTSARSKVFTSASTKGQAPPPIARKPPHLSSTPKISSHNLVISTAYSENSNKCAPPSILYATYPQNKNPHIMVEEKKTKEPPPPPQPRNVGKGTREPPLLAQPRNVSKGTREPPLLPQSRKVSKRTKDSPSPLQPQNLSKDTIQVSKESDVSNKNPIKPIVPDRKKSPMTLLESDIESSISSWEVLEPENNQMR
ncbi:Inositol-1,4,5-trisphosphate 5-phosphatase 1 [Erysiphe neolycopersici]|uniref:phosphoinositide 5-phosphatase n=1 Tax=Erysiphe neolycopersici TaxID=212602 RepID=A0A420I2M2_9PEZI|nr:Inositol-1,4,5-trisphosphate 5-phosphatase 1 [Erysiphe neolycopersici]